MKHFIYQLGLIPALLCLNTSCGTTEESHLSQEPTDEWLGFGMDQITGLFQDNCYLDQGVTVTPRRQTVQEASIAFNSTQIARSIERNIETDSALSFALFSGQRKSSRATSYYSEVGSNEIVAIARVQFTKEIRSFRPAVPDFDDDAIARLEYSDLAFRQRCGDAFIRQAEVGSRMTIILRGKLTSSQISRKVDVKKSVQKGLGIFGYQSEGSSSSSSTTDFNDIRFTSHCMIEGAAAPNLCKTAGLSFSNRSNLEDLRQHFINAINEFNRQVGSTPDGHVLLNWQTEAYKKPYYLELDRQDVFYRYRDRGQHVNRLGSLAEELDSICYDLDQILQVCQVAKVKLDQLLRSCADQARWGKKHQPECLSYPSKDSYRWLPETKPAFDLANAGSVTLFDGYHFTGFNLTLNIHNLYNSHGQFRPHQLYDIAPFGFGDNRLSSLASNLHPLWKITFYEYPGLAIGYRTANLQGTSSIGDLRYFGPFDFDNMASSFIIHR